MAMSFQYRFTHTCGHTGFGPIVNAHSGTTRLPLICSQPAPYANTTTLPLNLEFSCPFCMSSASNHLSLTPPGSGLLTVLNSTPDSLFAPGWAILKACRFEELEPSDWDLAFEGMTLDGRYRQMAWIPRPCGEVRFEGLDEAQETMKVGTFWRYTGCVAQIGHGRFAGLLSSLHKAVLDREKENEIVAE
ncbi:hypothetical protein ONS95_007708 [Cadophora gregata]|uniref:uncharacterized protein n=1 Tax=Cadophora gregata TaxID=51156 RepID=UPI0026DD60FF|nr:uncharacterized protein ONS95_007708 [Cadophora gregata]KAK0118827.1 hypothetical protein ONS96_011909 [Cadophora gregata f. sp. sojae]KAK0126088.1 hypothetical protein ONS95_007708 [Cadophora gregata]